MRKYILTLSLLLTLGAFAFGQTTDALVSNCVLNAGENAKYLKDFRVQLGKASAQTDLRYRANMSLWKNTVYRFTMCTTPDSKGQLILTIKDDANKQQVSSFDQKTGKVYQSVDFKCQKSGIYQISYDFTDGQQGSGVGVVSMVK